MKKWYFVFAILSFLSINLLAEDIKYFHAPGWYPFTMKNEETNEIYGASIDIMNAIAKDLGVKAEYVDVPWKRGFSFMDTGEVDICPGAYDNAERREKYIFSIPFMKNETRIFVKKDKSFKFEKLEDLKGKKLVKALGASFGGEFDNYAKDNNLDITENPKGKESMFKMLLLDRVDGVLMDYYDTMYYLRNNNFLLEIEPLEKPVNTVDVYLLISKKSDYGQQVEKINDSIKKLIDSKKIDTILSNY